MNDGSQTKHRRFDFWEGDKYKCGSSFGCRLLVLGESMYEGVPNSLTPNIISEVLIPATFNPSEKKRRFYTNVFQLVTGKQRRQASYEDVERFWHDIAFYNFVQCPVGTTPDTGPTPTMFNDSGRAFEEVVADLLPHAILVCGKALWDSLRRLKLIEVTADGFGRLKVTPPTCKLAYVNHPSRRFAWRWHDTVRRLLSSTVSESKYDGE